jgi:hypothetical protein
VTADEPETARLEIDFAPPPCPGKAPSLEQPDRLGLDGLQRGDAHHQSRFRSAANGRMRGRLKDRRTRSMMVSTMASAEATASFSAEAGLTPRKERTLVADLDSLTEEQWTRLDEIYWKNDQLYTGVLPSGALKRMYQWHGREWPPPKPSPSEDPWASPAVSASD